MAPQSNVSLNSPNKPSKLLALLAIVVAISLPFILVKTFPHKNKSIIDSIPLTMPVTEDGGYDDSDETEDAAESASTASKTVLVTSPVISKPSPPIKTTILPAVPKIAAAPAKNEWKIIKTRPKDTLASIFKSIGLSAKTLQAVMLDSSYTKALAKLKPNEELQLLVNNQSLVRMIIPYTSTQYLIVYRDGERYKSKIEQRKMNSHNHFTSATVTGSLYGTAKRMNIPSKLIKQMTEIFAWDINFAKDVKSGDQFTIIYKAFYIENKLINTGDIIAVTYKNRGKTYQAVRHTNRTGRSEYFTPQGTSLKKAFTRYPLHFSHISSPFSLARYHPILHYTRSHKGVDLAARIGTPIQSTGDGRIEIIGRQNAYGNMIKIKHNNTYSTVYGHMLKFQKGLSKGSFVKRGQVIGYVGQTGLASGPHCHYEFHVSNSPKNPTTINLPRGDAVSSRELARFKANTNTLLAQMQHFEKAQLASASKKGKHRA